MRVLSPPRLTINICINLGGIGLGLLLWVLSELEVQMPKVALYALLALAIGMIVVPWLALGVQRFKRRGVGGSLGDLGPEIYAAQKEERTKRAQQIARENVDREAQV